jgi:hypothetical protein
MQISRALVFQNGELWAHLRAQWWIGRTIQHIWFSACKLSQYHITKKSYQEKIPKGKCVAGSRRRTYSVMATRKGTKIQTIIIYFNKLLECARLTVNIDKTEAICLGSKRSCYLQLLPDKHLSWNISGKIKLLGISFNLSESDKTLGNFTETFQSVKKILNLWSIEILHTLVQLLLLRP